MSWAGKVQAMAMVLASGAAAIGVLLLLASSARSRRGERVQVTLFLLPSVMLLCLGLVYPAGRTVLESFKDGDSRAFVGLANYRAIFDSAPLRLVLRNTAIWAVLVPVVATAIGLLFAVLVDRSRLESLAKAMIFLPMAISFVGASIIWKFMYEYRPPTTHQIGVVNELVTAFGGRPRQLLLHHPSNTLLLVAVMVWIQAGFAMTVLSAALKAVPDDIVEAARIDGAGAMTMFRYVTLPSIRPALIVVLTTISIATLKVFDIVRTMTGGQFGTSVVANEFFNQSFIYGNVGLGAALAVLLFVLVMPVVAYNVRQLRRAEAR
jgi:alpha-glucoside transport system permease protein